MGIEVVAKQRGFYLKLREKGDRFFVSNEVNLGRWMEVLPSKAEPPKADDRAAKKAKA